MSGKWDLKSRVLGALMVHGPLPADRIVQIVREQAVSVTRELHDLERSGFATPKAGLWVLSLDGERAIRRALNSKMVMGDGSA